MQIRFEDYLLDDDRYLLERAGERVNLRPKVFDLLVYLACHRDRVVRREELVRELWDTTTVGEGALSGLVNELRQALGEQGRRPSSIRTVHARGYQFVAAVEIADAEQPDSAGAEGRPDRIGGVIERVAAHGAIGIVIEACTREAPPGGGPVEDPGRHWPSLDRLLWRAEQTGFEVHRLIAPDESQVSPARFARQLIDSMIGRRGRARTAAALPLPARRWLEDEGMDRVAGGTSRARAGPPGPLSAMARLLGELSRARPLVILVEDLERAGSRFASDLVTLKERLIRAPVLWVVPITAAPAGRSCLEHLTWEGRFEHWVESSRPRTTLDRSLRRVGLEPLPEPLFAALDAHLRGEAAGFSTIADWVSMRSEGGRRSAQARDAPVDDAPVEGADDQAAGGRRMRRVEPARPRSELRSSRS